MAQTLDDQVYQAQPPPISYAAAPASAPLPQRQQQQQQQAWSPWAQQPQQQYTQPSQQELAQSLANLSMTSIPPPAPLALQPPPPPATTTTTTSQLPPSVPSLTASIPILSQLQEAAQHVVSPTHDPALKIAWCRDVFVLVDRATGSLAATDPPVGPVTLVDTALDRLAHTETVFALANGHIGLRGNLDEGEPFGLPGTYLNGFYETRPLPYAEAAYGNPEDGQTVVDVTNGKIIRLLVDDEPLEVVDAEGWDARRARGGRAAQ